MKDLHAIDLSSVVGGSRKRDPLNEQLMTLQTSLKNITTSKGGCSGNTMMLLIMAMAMRPGPSPIINVSARFRR